MDFVWKMYRMHSNEKFINQFFSMSCASVLNATDNYLDIRKLILVVYLHATYITHQ